MGRIQQLAAITMIWASAAAQSPHEGSPSTSPEQARDLARLLAYIDEVCMRASYGFACSLTRLSTAPGDEAHLTKEMAHLERILHKRPRAPLTTCRGTVRGAQWIVDVQSTLLDKQGSREIFYFDGQSTARYRPEGRNTTIIARRFSTGIGLQPWSLFEVSTKTQAGLIRKAQAAKELVMLPLPPATAEDAGANQLYAIRYRGFGLRFEMIAVIGPDRANVRTITCRVRQGPLAQARVTYRIELREHRSVDGLQLPQRMRYESSIETRREEGLPDTRVVYHWRIRHQPDGPSPQDLIRMITDSRVVSSKGRRFPVAGLELQIEAFAAQASGKQRDAGPFALTTAPAAGPKWPAVTTWSANLPRQPLTLTEVRDTYTMHTAVASCARLCGSKLRLGAVLRSDPDPDMPLERAVDLLTESGHRYVKTTVATERLARARDPLIIVRHRTNGRLQAEAGYMKNRKFVVWQPASVHRQPADVIDPTETIAILSERDAARMQR